MSVREQWWQKNIRNSYGLYSYLLEKSSKQPHYQGCLCRMCVCVCVLSGVIWPSLVRGYSFEEEPNNVSSCLGLAAAVVFVLAVIRGWGLTQSRKVFQGHMVCVFALGYANCCTVWLVMGRRIWKTCRVFRIWTFPSQRKIPDVTEKLKSLGVFLAFSQTSKILQPLLKIILSTELATVSVPTSFPPLSLFLH